MGASTRFGGRFFCGVGCAQPFGSTSSRSRQKASKAVTKSQPHLCSASANVRWHVVGPGAASRNRPPSDTRRSQSLQSPVRRHRLPSARTRAAVFVDEDSASRQLVAPPSRQPDRQCGKAEHTVAGQASHRICVYARIYTHSRIHLPIHYCISTHTHTRTDGRADKTVTGAGWAPSLTASRLRPKRALLLIGCGCFRGARLGSASARM